jgi:D-alanyl-D-alanine carboxypeptidase
MKSPTATVALLVLLVLLAVDPTAARGAGATTAAVAEWTKLCRKADAGQLQAWYDRHLNKSLTDRLPNALRAQHDAELCAATGGLVPRQSHSAALDATSVMLVGRSLPLWMRLSYSQSGAVFTQFELDLAWPDESALPRDLGDAALSHDIAQWIAQLGARGLFSGIVVVARGPEPIAVATAGYADRAKRTPFDQSSQFTLGSLGKLFTATAVGELVDQGKLSLEDPVGRYFPQYPDAAIRERATVAMLLSHTAGLGDFLRRRPPVMMSEGVRRADEYLPLFERDALQFPPGTGWSYSNAGFALAGAIIEKVSGESYPDFLRHNVFATAGMTDSDPNNLAARLPRLVAPYTRMTPQGPVAEWHEAEHDIGSPAGGAVSTAADLVKFADALGTGRLVSATMLRAMATPHGTTPWNTGYGYAMEIADVYGQPVVGHGGGFPGVSTHLHLVLGTRYAIVVLANQDPPADAYAGNRIVALVAEKAKTGQ